MCPDGKTLAPGGDVTKCPAPIQPAPPVTPPEKAGLSTGAIVAAGLGAAALVGVVAYAATRKKKKGHVVHRKTPRHHGKRK